MKITRMSFLFMVATCLSFGCTQYPSGFFVKTNSLNREFQNDTLICHAEGERNANLIMPKSFLTSMEYYHVRAEEALGALIILTVTVPLEMERRQQWVNIYFNTMRACMEDRGYSWISDSEEPGISSLKRRVERE